MKIHDPLTDTFRLTEIQQKALKRLRIETIEDLLYHFPARYGDTAEITTIDHIDEKTNTSIFGKIKNLKTGKTFTSKMSRATATLEDDTGSISITWFNQPYLAKILKEGSLVKVTGKPTLHKNGLTFNNPHVESVTRIPTGVGHSLFSNTDTSDAQEAYFTLYPVYPESKGISSNWVIHSLQKVFKSGLLDEIVDPLPSEVLEKYNLPTLSTALLWIHAPKKESHALSARKRFAFEEIFYIQLRKYMQRKENESKKSFVIDVDEEKIKEFTSRFPFELTNTQQKAIRNIIDDFKKGIPMSRLLEGDVGSGKTAVAATAVYAATITTPRPDQDFGHLQTAYMVPTEILAKQHFAHFIEFFKHMNVKIALITGSGCYKFPSKVNPEEPTKISRAQLAKWIENGEIPIVIGTHALIQKTLQFKNLAFVIIDEQHRFGTLQRQKLARKDDFSPHLLSMTATPIPRTLALTIYGDLDLTLLDQMPHGRKPIITDIVLPTHREKTYEKIRSEIEDGRQVYVICPRIDEPDPDKQTALNVKSVKAEAKRLKEKVFQDKEIDILHSKMKPAEKEEVMGRFESGEIDILCATSVVEVGVNVPNATVIIIEGAERFGLSQLHQLRGRVIRSNHQAYCYVFADTENAKSIERLKALKTAKDGFKLSELDLSLRGSGQLAGTKQWGISDLGMEAIKNIKMVEAARNEARSIVDEEKISNYPTLEEKISNVKEVHFE